MHRRATQCKQAAYSPFLSKLGKGRQRNMCACLMGIPRNAWAENIANLWLPCTNISWKLQSAITLIQKCESKFFKVKSLVLTHSACP